MRDENAPRKPETYEPLADTAATLGLIVLLMRAVAFIHELFTRRIGSMGREYPNGFVMVVGVFFVPMFAVLLASPAYGHAFLRPYFLLVFVLAVAHALAKLRQPRHVHRHYIGDPWIDLGNRRGEWLLGAGLTVLMFLACNTFGLLHLVSLLCSQMCQDMIEARDRRIVRRMREAQQEAEYYTNRLNDQ